MSLPVCPADAIVPVSGLVRAAFQWVATQTCGSPHAATRAVYTIGAARLPEMSII